MTLMFTTQPRACHCTAVLTAIHRAQRLWAIARRNRNGRQLRNRSLQDNPATTCNAQHEGVQSKGASFQYVRQGLLHTAVHVQHMSPALQLSKNLL